MCRSNGSRLKPEPGPSGSLGLTASFELGFELGQTHSGSGRRLVSTARLTNQRKAVVVVVARPNIDNFGIDIKANESEKSDPPPAQNGAQTGSKFENIETR